MLPWRFKVSALVMGVAGDFDALGNPVIHKWCFLMNP